MLPHARCQDKPHRSGFLLCKPVGRVLACATDRAKERRWRAPSCQYCRWFSLVSDGAVIAAATTSSAITLPRKGASCRHFDSERRVEARDAAGADDPTSDLGDPARPR